MSFIDTSDEVIKQMKIVSRKACRKIAKEISKEFVQIAPIKRGSIRKSIHSGARISSTTGQAYGSVGILSKKKLQAKGIKFVVNPYWMEFGTRLHYIKNKESSQGAPKKVLANKRSGVMFGKSIVHSGSKRVPFLGDAAKKVAPNALKIAESELKILTETIEKIRAIPDDGNDEV